VKTFYHGTINKFVQSILTEGLTPDHPEKRWNANKVSFFSSFNPAKEDPMGFVYVLDWQGQAAEYAAAKARYYKTLPGETFRAAYGVDFIKAPDAPVILDAAPAVLKVTVPDVFGTELDPQDYNGMRYKGTIPGEFIKRIPYKTSVGVDNRDEVSKLYTEAMRQDLDRRVFDDMIMSLSSRVLRSQR